MSSVGAPRDRHAPRGLSGAAVFGILTITPQELLEARAVFNLNVLVPTSETPYFVGQPSADGDYDVVVCKSLDRTNVPAYESVAELIFQFAPEFILVIGTAGGVDGQDNVALGDVVIADFIEYSEFRKVVAGKNRPRNVSHDHPSLRLRRHAEAVASVNDWHTAIYRPKPNPGVPNVLPGNVLVCEKIWGDYTNPQQVALLEEFDKAMAIETESYGVARAVFHARNSVHYNPQLLVVRGVSDMVKTPSNDAQRHIWTEYAACSACAFARALIQRVLAFRTAPSKTRRGSPPGRTSLSNFFRALFRGTFALGTLST